MIHFFFSQSMLLPLVIVILIRDMVLGLADCYKGKIWDMWRKLGLFSTFLEAWSQLGPGSKFGSTDLRKPQLLKSSYSRFPDACLHPSPNVPSQSRILAPKWVTHHFWEIHNCRAAPLNINAIMPICGRLVAARMTLCAVLNTSHPHILETRQESRMKAFVGWRLIKDFALEMRCGRFRITFPFLFSLAQQQFSVPNRKSGVSSV